MLPIAQLYPAEAICPLFRKVVQKCADANFGSRQTLEGEYAAPSLLVVISLSITAYTQFVYSELERLLG